MTPGASGLALARVPRVATCGPAARVAQVEFLDRIREAP